MAKNVRIFRKLGRKTVGKLKPELANDLFQVALGAQKGEACARGRRACGAPKGAAPEKT